MRFVFFLAFPGSRIACIDVFPTICTYRLGRYRGKCLFCALYCGMIDDIGQRVSDESHPQMVCEFVGDFVCDI